MSNYNMDPETLSKLPRDMIVYIALNMDLPEILNLCQTNTRLNETICKNRNFWIQRLLQDYNLEYLKAVVNNESPRDFYIRINKIYTDSTPNSRLSVFAVYGSLYLVERAISEGANYYFIGVAEASKKNHKEIVMYLLKQLQLKGDFHRNIYEEVLNNGMIWAIDNNNIDLADNLLEIGGNAGEALSAAAGTGRRDLVDHYIEMGATDLYRAYDSAIFHPELQKYIQSLIDGPKVKSDFDIAMDVFKSGI